MSVCSTRNVSTRTNAHEQARTNNQSHTSSAFKSATPPPLVSALTDLENSSLVCSSICSKSASVSSSSMRRRDARSGFRRKNSRQNPSDSLSYSASSSSLESQPGRRFSLWGDRGGLSSNLSSHGKRRASALDSADQKKELKKSLDF